MQPSLYIFDRECNRLHMMIDELKGESKAVLPELIQLRNDHASLSRQYAAMSHSYDVVSVSAVL